MSPYQSHFYWENQLIRNDQFWKSAMLPIKDPRDMIFAHTAIIGYEGTFLDFNWTCFENAEKLLDFLQFIYLPTAFYHWLNPGDDQIKIPVNNQKELISYLQEFPKKDQNQMEANFSALQKCWAKEKSDLFPALRQFAEEFNKRWQSKEIILSIHLFKSTNEIAEHLIQLSQFPEVVEEDYGMTEAELRRMCSDFYTNQMIQKTFLSLLQNRIGCIA